MISKNLFYFKSISIFEVKVVSQNCQVFSIRKDNFSALIRKNDGIYDAYLSQVFTKRKIYLQNFKKIKDSIVNYIDFYIDFSRFDFNDNNNLKQDNSIVSKSNINLKNYVTCDSHNENIEEDNLLDTYLKNVNNKNIALNTSKYVVKGINSIKHIFNRNNSYLNKNKSLKRSDLFDDKEIINSKYHFTSFQIQHCVKFSNFSNLRSVAEKNKILNELRRKKTNDKSKRITTQAYNISNIDRNFLKLKKKSSKHFSLMKKDSNISVLVKDNSFYEEKEIKSEIFSKTFNKPKNEMLIKIESTSNVLNSNNPNSQKNGFLTTKNMNLKNTDISFYCSNQNEMIPPTSSISSASNLPLRLFSKNAKIISNSNASKFKSSVVRFDSHIKGNNNSNDDSQSIISKKDLTSKGLAINKNKPIILNSINDKYENVVDQSNLNKNSTSNNNSINFQKDSKMNQNKLNLNHFPINSSIKIQQNTREESQTQTNNISFENNNFKVLNNLNKSQSNPTKVNIKSPNKIINIKSNINFNKKPMILEYNDEILFSKNKNNINRNNAELLHTYTSNFSENSICLSKNLYNYNLKNKANNTFSTTNKTFNDLNTADYSINTVSSFRNVKSNFQFNTSKFNYSSINHQKNLASWHSIQSYSTANTPINCLNLELKSKEEQILNNPQISERTEDLTNRFSSINPSISDFKQKLNKYKYNINSYGTTNTKNKSLSTLNNQNSISNSLTGKSSKKEFLDKLVNKNSKNLNYHLENIIYDKNMKKEHTKVPFISDFVKFKFISNNMKEKIISKKNKNDYVRSEVSWNIKSF